MRNSVITGSSVGCFLRNGLSGRKCLFCEVRRLSISGRDVSHACVLAALQVSSGSSAIQEAGIAGGDHGREGVRTTRKDACRMSRALVSSS